MTACKTCTPLFGDMRGRSFARTRSTSPSETARSQRVSLAGLTAFVWEGDAHVSHILLCPAAYGVKAREQAFKAQQREQSRNEQEGKTCFECEGGTATVL